jgi:putative ABC transport system permease protein
MATPKLLAIRLAGVLVAVTLVAGVSLYSAAMGDAMLQQRVRTDPDALNFAVSQTGRPLAPADFAALDRYIRRGMAADLHLPQHDPQAHHETRTVSLYRAGSGGTLRGHAPLATLGLDYYDGLAGHIEMIAGTLAGPTQTPAADAPVVVSDYTAHSLHLRVGDRLAFSADGTKAITPRIVVAGIYLAKDPTSTFWSNHTGETTYRSLVTPRVDTFQRFAGQGRLFSPSYFWLQQANLGDVHLADAAAIDAGINRVNSTISSISPAATFITSLNLDIGGFLDQYDLLPIILLILVTPIIALILYGVSMTTALVLDLQAGEIVLMRSRGATRGQTFALYVGEGVLLGGVALLVGPFLGLLMARLISHASGFLSFGGGLPITLRLLPETYLYSGITALLCLLAGLLPAIALTNRSMTSFKSEKARQRGKPLWQRLYLDLVALAAALYGLVVLEHQGVVTSGAATAAVAQDPLIAIAPLLFAVAITLLLSRVLPWLASLGLHLLGTFSSPSAYVALQSVSRAPRGPMRLVQLCTLTLTLGIFAATVAGVEASNLSDQYQYQAGATVRLMETFDRHDQPANLRNQPDIMPISTHLALPGVRAATPALRYESFGQTTNNTNDGTAVNVLGVDPATAASVMWDRPDFAARPFAGLMRMIGSDGPAVIVSATFLSTTGLHVGDAFTTYLSNGAQVQFKIAGVALYFPSLDPGEYPFVIANLSYLEKVSGSHGPNEVWLKTDPGQAAVDKILAAVRQWPRQTSNYVGLPPPDAAQNNPLTAGIYGVVSVGFLIAAALALLGFITYSYLALQQRLVEVAILRALGLSDGQVRSLLLFEEVFLLGAAILGGIVAGLLTTQLFLPYMPIATNAVPPFLVVMPWAAVGEFVVTVLVVFVLVLIVHVSLVLRTQLGGVLRLGDG